MRTPSEYLAAAVRRVQSQLMPDCALTMTHGDDSATVTRVSATTQGGDELTGDDPVEAVRVLALASDFPNVSRGDLANLGDDTHIVTSVRIDASGASAYVGLSKPLMKHAANVSGVRGNRAVRLQVGVLVINNGLAEDLTEGYSPTTVHSWTLIVAVDDWQIAGEPQVGDNFKFDKDGESVTVKVARCNRRERHYILSARSR